MQRCCGACRKLRRHGIASEVEPEGPFPSLCRSSGTRFLAVDEARASARCRGFARVGSSCPPSPAPPLFPLFPLPSPPARTLLLVFQVFRFFFLSCLLVLSCSFLPLRRLLVHSSSNASEKHASGGGGGGASNSSVLVHSREGGAGGPASQRPSAGSRGTPTGPSRGGGSGGGVLEPTEQDARVGGDRGQSSWEDRRRAGAMGLDQRSASAKRGGHAGGGDGGGGAGGAGGGGGALGGGGGTNAYRPASESPERRSLPPKKDIHRRDSPPAAEA